MNWDDIYNKAYLIVNFFINEKTENSNKKTDFLDEEESFIAQKLKDSNYLYNNLLQRKKFDYRRAYLSFCWHTRLNIAKKYLITATSAAIIIGGVFFVNYRISKHTEIENLVAVEYPQIKPGIKKATLMLASGTKIDLGKADSLIIESEGVVINIGSDSIKYEKSKIATSNKNELVYNTLEVPRGGEFFTILSDGTKVWLNADSKLRYPLSFFENNRVVFLEGEAYFEVKKENSKQFVVSTFAGDVIVHGTEFNVKGYLEDSCVITTLVKGSVEFKEGGALNGTRLEPSQQVSYSSKTGNKTLQWVNVNNYVGWKDNLLQFEEETLEDIMKIISRWYDVTVAYESNDIKNMKFSGSLNKYKNIDSFIRLFEATGKIKYEIENKNILIKRKTR